MLHAPCSLQMEDDHQSRRRRPSFSSALLEAISRSTETSQASIHPNRPLRRWSDDFTLDRRKCCCDSSSCKWKNVATPYMGRHAPWEVQRPKVKDTDTCKRKPKQPMSPGSKLASFLNSLFVPTSTKRKPMTASGRSKKDKEKAASHSVSSSSSTPHLVDASQWYDTNHKPNNSVCSNKEKNRKNPRCVTFDPTTVILRKNENALGKYSATKVDNTRNAGRGSGSGSDSDSSSDLFELHNFNAMDIYSTDLPVYETTHLETNKAIAKGLL